MLAETPKTLRLTEALLVACSAIYSLLARVAALERLTEGIMKAND